MIWLAWRQFRVQAIAAAVPIVVLAVLIITSGSDLRHLYGTNGLAACKARGGCAALESSFLSHDKALQDVLGALVLVVPALVGVFWGAPLLARELETGTYRLAWTQSISRRHWLAGKIAVVGLASIVVAELVSLMVSWWFKPLDAVSLNRFTPGVFSERGVVSIGYAAFAFAAGVAAGAVARRTIPAMVATLSAFAGARLAITYGLRANLAHALHATQRLVFGSNADLELGPTSALLARKPTIPNAWIIGTRIADAAGHTPTRQSTHAFMQQHCPAIALPNPKPPGANAYERCEDVLRSHFHVALTYQPARNYWPFQGYETTIFLALAITLIAGCFWWLRPGRRVKATDRPDPPEPKDTIPDEVPESRVITLTGPRSTRVGTARPLRQLGD